MQRAKCPYVLYVKPFNNGFIIPLLRHFLVFWLLLALTENRIDCIIKRVRMTKTTQMKTFKCPFFDYINEMTSDKR